MKLKIMSVVIASIISSQNVFAESKTIDFYSNNGANRYSIEGKVKDLNNLSINKNRILIDDANSESYITLNNDNPYHSYLIESDLNIYQIFETNKGKSINYKGKEVKIINLQNDKLLVDDGDNIIFIPIEEVSIPKSFLNDSKKGLQVSFSKDIKDDDVLYYSQPENNLSYNNSYQANINEKQVKFTHYLNITNTSLKTFDNVYLNFFLSETNIQNNNRPIPMMKAALRSSSSLESLNDSIQEPSYENQEIQNLKSISIKEPTTIYPNFNKIKYVEKNYEMEQYARLKLQDEYTIYFGDEIDESMKNYYDLKADGKPLNKIYKQKINEIKETIISNENIFENIIEIKLNKEDIIPKGKIDIYENYKGKDKLIVSTNIGHTENKNIEILKNRNRDLIIKNIDFEEPDTESLIKTLEKFKTVKLKIKSIEIENRSNNDYIINLFNKKTKIEKNKKIILEREKKG